MDILFADSPRLSLMLGVLVFVIFLVAFATFINKDSTTAKFEGVPIAKSEYTDTLVSAMLYCDIGKSPVIDIDRVESVEMHDNQIYIECATTEQQLRLGHNSYLVARGVPISCIKEDVTQVQLYLDHKLLWEEDIYDFTNGDDGNFEGYLGDGADICVFYGHGLTMVAKQAKVP